MKDKIVCVTENTTEEICEQDSQAQEVKLCTSQAALLKQSAKKTVRLDPTRYGDWEKNGRCIDF